MLQNKLTWLKIGATIFAFVVSSAQPMQASQMMEHCFSVKVQQNPGKQKPRMNWLELRKKQEAFITQNASLTQAEADFFFPLFHELKQKQREIRHRIHRISKDMEQGTHTEKQCDKYLEEIGKLHKQSTELEISYHKKWRKKLSASKIIKILSADRRFSKQVFDRKIK